MKYLNRLSLAAVALLLVCGLAISSPAFAEDTSSDTSGDSTANAETETEGHDIAKMFTLHAATDMKSMRQSLHKHTEAQRQKACNALKTSLTHRMSKAVTNAAKHKTVFDNIYAKVKNFYTSKGLSVANYDGLTTAVDKAQSDAAANIVALQSLQVNVDCSSQTVADSVSAFRAAVRATRDSLKTYRSAIVDLIKALEGASSSNDNSAGSDQ